MPQPRRRLSVRPQGASQRSLLDSQKQSSQEQQSQDRYTQEYISESQGSERAGGRQFISRKWYSPSPSIASIMLSQETECRASQESVSVASQEASQTHRVEWSTQATDEGQNSVMSSSQAMEEAYSEKPLKEPLPVNLKAIKTNPSQVYEAEQTSFNSESQQRNEPPSLSELVLAGKAKAKKRIRLASLSKKREPIDKGPEFTKLEDETKVSLPVTTSTVKREQASQFTEIQVRLTISAEAAAFDEIARIRSFHPPVRDLRPWFEQVANGVDGVFVDEMEIVEAEVPEVEVWSACFSGDDSGGAELMCI
ncbi:hypothetical protein HDU96_009001 [Phlyctochytrium bullatum]|nr:hypothetical protein HDU96_009001 [Phlyctochytrium bullatum]